MKRKSALDDVHAQAGKQSHRHFCHGPRRAAGPGLSRLGVDVIEGGFPVSSLGDFEAVKTIAKTVGRQADPPEICGLCRCVKGDIETCGEAVKPAKRPRIHTFIATSDIHWNISSG